MKLVYMEKTLQLIAKTQGVEVAKAIEQTGEIKYLEDTPYLIIKIND
jgi:hypothetical protein